MHLSLYQKQNRPPSRWPALFIFNPEAVPAFTMAKKFFDSVHYYQPYERLSTVNGPEFPEFSAPSVGPTGHHTINSRNGLNSSSCGTIVPFFQETPVNGDSNFLKKYDRFILPLNGVGNQFLF